MTSSVYIEPKSCVVLKEKSVMKIALQSTCEMLMLFAAAQMKKMQREVSYEKGKDSFWS